MTGLGFVFLDANILFSAAIGGPSFLLLLDLAGRGAIQLVTSEACVVEARTNLERKRPDAAPRLDALLVSVRIEASAPDDDLEWAATSIHPDDAHVLAATRTAGASVLVTGDTTHFGHLMGRRDLGIRVMTLRTLLVEGIGQE